jgi:hypothetical protein
VEVEVGGKEAWEEGYGEAPTPKVIPPKTLRFPFIKRGGPPHHHLDPYSLNPLQTQMRCTEPFSYDISSFSHQAFKSIIHPMPCYVKVQRGRVHETHTRKLDIDMDPSMEAHLQ